MKIGFVQMAPVLGDPAATLEVLDRLIPEAADADLLVLPELCNSGYNFSTREQAWSLSESATDGGFVRFLRDTCRRLNMHIVAGLNERDGHLLYNTAVLVGPGGTEGKYRKLHLFVDEKDFFVPGDLGAPVFQIGHCRIGILICFDWLFPEIWRVLALKGADIICHPSNLVIPGLCQRAVPVHALTNRVFTITANRIGTEGDLTFTGLSTISSPRGETLGQASPDKEEVLVVEIDPAQARDKMITRRNHAFDDRRPEEYRLLTESDPE